MFSSRHWPALVFAAIFVAAPARAQTEIREHVTGYAPGYFASNQPSSAYDMVNLLPGFSLVEGDVNVRGYSGALGNVLIDGRPPASKQEKLADILKRIPAGAVERVELLRPGVAGMDMQGYALLANVVRKVSNAPRMRMESEYVRYSHDRSAPKLAGEFALGSVYVLNLQAQVNRDLGGGMGPGGSMMLSSTGMLPGGGGGGGVAGYGDKNRYKPDGSPLLLATYDHPRYTNGWLVTGGWRQPLFGGALHFSVLVSETRAIGTIIEKDYYPIIAQSGGGEREMRNVNEFGLQYSHGLWSGADVEIIGIRRSSNFHQTQSVTSATSILEAIRASGTDETILRNVLRVNGGVWSVELGAEGALNGLNNRIAYRANGTLVPLPSANVKVSEVRGEGFLIGTWHVLPRLTLEAGARYEMSQLKQQGDAVLTRKLSYLKPHALVTWNVTNSDELRLLYERQAGQLDFNSFVSSVMIAQGNVAGGNPNIKPYTQWETEFAWEHRFKVGSIVATVRDQRISDTVDHIMLNSKAGPLDAMGNVGNGHRQELVANFNLPLDWISALLSRTTLQGSFLLRSSRIINPLDGQAHKIGMEADAEGRVNFTKDIPSAHMRWGVTYAIPSQRRAYRFNETVRNRFSDAVNAFVEYKPVPDWQLRLFGENLTNRPQSRIRDVFSGPRNLVAVRSYTEFNPQNLGPRVGINVQHTLGD